LDWGGFSFKAESLIRKNLDTTSPNPEDNADEAVTRQQSLDYFALLLGTIFIPLARAERIAYGAFPRWLSRICSAC